MYGIRGRANSLPPSPPSPGSVPTVRSRGWNDDPDWYTPPGTFESITASVKSVCGFERGRLRSMLVSSRGVPSTPEERLPVTCREYGDGTSVCREESDRLVSVPVDLTFTYISRMFDYACGLLDNGTVHCWNTPTTSSGMVSSGGRDAESRQHGRRTRLRPPTRRFGGLLGQILECKDTASGPDHRFTSIASGRNHTCGILTDGTLECWGRNGHGQASPPGSAR